MFGNPLPGSKTRVFDASNTRVTDMTNIPDDFFKLKLNCEHAEELSPLKNLGELGFLELTGFKVEHGLSWMKLSMLNKLSLEGESIVDRDMLGWLENAKALRRLRLPAGSVFDPAWVDKLNSLESVHVGEKRVWYWKDHLATQN